MQKHKTSRQELDDLREVVARDLKDAEIPVLSSDRRFATAYNAALQLAKMAIACAGYRVTAKQHHEVTLRVVKFALGRTADPYSAYFESCRRKRNKLDYDAAGVISETESEELVEKVNEFCRLVERWIAKHHPSFAV
ncbi:MAG: hypothetical protein HYS13_12625 [Planctomycetia bacterium]|nr:hypothetical protein [Planctomycetia bacterium]